MDVRHKSVAALFVIVVMGMVSPAVAAAQSGATSPVPVEREDVLFADGNGPPTRGFGGARSDIDVRISGGNVPVTGPSAGAIDSTPNNRQLDPEGEPATGPIYLLGVSLIGLALIARRRTPTVAVN